MLSDRDILKSLKTGELTITPFHDDRLGPASYDLLLDDEVRIVWSTDIPLDLTDFEPGYTYKHSLRSDGPVVLEPGACMLASTQESISLKDHVVCQIEGRSSMARLFQYIHVTAGFVDPGWSGQITLEIKNGLTRPVVYTYGMRVAQAIFYRMARSCDRAYATRGQYQHQTGPQEAKPIQVIL